jgi:hypothetical protein
VKSVHFCNRDVAGHMYLHVLCARATDASLAQHKRCLQRHARGGANARISSETVPDRGADRPCLPRGNYTHRDESTAGFSGWEVWLCCVSIEELARASFQCADESIGSLFEDTLYMKVRFCSLLHPTSTDPTLIPVCVPAPVVAPVAR